jgi:primosomal protein N' (replication factor Y)
LRIVFVREWTTRSATGHRQGELFEAEPEPWELDDADDWLVARVVFARRPHGPFDYLVPADPQLEIQPGARVEVPLGRGDRLMEGYCAALLPGRQAAAAGVHRHRLKPIARLLDASPLVPGPLVELAAWISRQYVANIGVVLETIVPPGVRRAANVKVVHRVRLASPPADGGDVRLTALQRRILDYLRAADRPIDVAEIAREFGCTAGPINTLRRRGLVERVIGHVERREFERSRPRAPSDLDLNAEQQRALDAIVESVASGQHATLLLHGVTGSGKTEIYIRAIEEVLRYGRQAIVLVPEISLTPQTRQRFESRFDRVAVIHSNLSATERAWQWRRIAAGTIDVVIGARSAVFAPLAHLGLIVIDEEHDASFKQDSTPRYHAREVAQWRAARHGVPLVLGTATPALESWQQAQRGAYRLLTLSHRVLGRPLPAVHVADLRAESFDRASRGAIGRALDRAIRDALGGAGQVILLLNRRGFATRVQCPHCGHVETCPHCAISLTHHRDRRILICHYCDYHKAVPAICSECGAGAVRFSGIGTQRLEHELRARYPDVVSLRMDTDSMHETGSHERALDAFRRGQAQILLGTQMIAKGLDFPNVTLVGVINADTALHLPDFRAAERTFDLVAQVAGRSGRGPKGGIVLVQSFQPDHPAIAAAARHDYGAFAESELAARREFGYPPWRRMARVVARGADDTLALAAINDLAAQARQSIELCGSAAQLTGPSTAPLAKLHGLHRFQFQLLTPHEFDLPGSLAQLRLATKDYEGVQWMIDVDPHDMM